MAKVVTMGEIMLRLSTPGNQKYIQATQFDINYGGGEANVAVSLANYGHEAEFVTKVPANPIGQCAIAALRKYGVETEKTLTGFKFIGEKVAKYETTHEKEYVFGYEESYGSLIKPFVRDKDAQQACLMLAEAACYYAEKGKTLCDVLEDAYKEHGYYNESQTSIVLEGMSGAAKIKEIMTRLRTEKLQEINGVKVVKYQDFDTFEEGDKNGVKPLTGFTKSNVLKYFLEDGSWIAVRPSGTEPKIKIYYCIKGESSEDALDKAKKYEAQMKKLTA